LTSAAPALPCPAPRTDTNKKAQLVLTSRSVTVMKRWDGAGTVPASAADNEPGPENSLCITFGTDTEAFYGPWAHKQLCVLSWR
jgi:hypothetical protein